MLFCNDTQRRTDFTKQRVHAHFTEEYFRRRRRHSTNPAAFGGARLLTMPAQFMEDFPSVYASIFGSEDPVPSMVNLDQVEDIGRMGVVCRITHTRSATLDSLQLMGMQEEAWKKNN